MKGYCFTFGGYRELDVIDTGPFSATFTPRRDRLLQIKSSLVHPIFGIDGVMSSVRDYLSGGALLPVDIFPLRSVDSNEVYQILYSVACCKRCTMDVIGLVKECLRPAQSLSSTPSRMGFSAEQILHLIYRCSFLYKNAMFDVYYTLYYSEASTCYNINLIADTRAYSDLRYKVSRRSYADSNISRNVMEGIRLRVTDGKDLRDMTDHYHRCGSPMIDEEELIAIIMFGKKRHLKKIRKGYQRRYYYIKIWSLTAYVSLLTYMPSWRVLGLEELIVLSISSYMNISTFGILRKMRQRDEDMWSLPRVLLRKECVVIEDMHKVQSMIVEYESGDKNGKRRYTVCLRSDGTRAQYECGNGVRYSYYTLLLIIVHRFIFTYDREYLIKTLCRLTNVDQASLDYFDIPTTCNPIHDLITPPDIFLFMDREAHIDPDEVFPREEQICRRAQPHPPCGYTDLSPLMTELPYPSESD